MINTCCCKTLFLNSLFSHQLSSPSSAPHSTHVHSHTHAHMHTEHKYFQDITFLPFTSLVFVKTRKTQMLLQRPVEANNLYSQELTDGRIIKFFSFRVATLSSVRKQCNVIWVWPVLVLGTLGPYQTMKHTIIRSRIRSRLSYTWNKVEVSLQECDDASKQDGRVGKWLC